MGAWHFVQAPLRLRNLRVALDEYLRFGLEAGVFIVPQQPKRGRSRHTGNTAAVGRADSRSQTREDADRTAQSYACPQRTSRKVPRGRNSLRAHRGEPNEG